MRAIEVRGLGKEFKIGSVHGRPDTLVQAVGQAVRTPFRRAAGILRGRAYAAADLTESFWALRDVSFDVEAGEVVGIVGRNGAGKSTLLKILSRITEPTRGEAVVRGRLGSLLEVGTGFHPELTGRENIFLNGAILGMRAGEIRERLDEIVDFAGVERFLETPIKHYSSGMYLRLAFAVAAHTDPDILIVDEVLAVGDQEFQKKCLDRMHQTSHSGRTVLFVSHNLSAIESLCSRVLWLEEGRVREDGPAPEVIRRYLAGFLPDGEDRDDLSRVSRRAGGGGVRFTRIEYLTPERRPADVVRAGDPLVLRLHYRVEEAVSEPHFGVEIRTGHDLLLSETSTWASGYAVGKLEPGEGAIEVELPSLSLMPGRYYLSLWCSSVGGVDHDLLDRCAELDVAGSDFYGSGRGVDPRFGVLLLPCRWSLPG